jgi:DNA polymerase
VTDILREARALLALQREIAGPIRYLGAPLPAAPAAEPSPADAPARPAPSPTALPESAPPAVSTLFQPPEPAPDERSPYERIAALVPADSPLCAMSTLDEVRDWVARTVLVPIDAERQNAVFGTGNPQADLMVVGEAPGADEDRTGEPFVGRAGQLLDKILAAVHFAREDVYIANILKSRPPGNRDPLPAEAAAHLPILHRQIALVQPRLILAVGKSAGNGLLGKTASLASLRGTFHDFHGIPLLVTYHPAALLRNPQWKRPTWEDVQLLRTRYDALTA